MELSKLLEKQRTAILKKWLGEIFDTYPADTSRFLKSERDMFANPVGHTITINAEYILDGLIQGVDTPALSAYVERIIRIRAVQEFTPLQAVSFIKCLKTVIINGLKTEIDTNKLWDSWGEFETRIDCLTECANELHAEMKQKIAAIRARELDQSERFAKRLMENCK